MNALAPYLKMTEIRLAHLHKGTAGERIDVMKKVALGHFEPVETIRVGPTTKEVPCECGHGTKTVRLAGYPYTIVDQQGASRGYIDLKSAVGAAISRHIDELIEGICDA